MCKVDERQRWKTPVMMLDYISSVFCDMSDSRAGILLPDKSFIFETFFLDPQHQ
jgi:hypothetical protein